MKTYKAYILAATSGLLFSIAFPPLPFAFLAFVFAVPLLFALDQKPNHWFRLSYTFAFIQHLCSLWWIGSWQENTDPYLMVSGIVIVLFHPFFYFVLFGGYKFFRKRLNLDASLMVFPLLWTLYDWLTSTTDFAFPWLSLGYTQVNSYYWNQIADIGGVLLLGLLIAFVNVCIYKLITIYSEHRLNFSAFFKLKDVRKYASIALLLIILPMIYSVIRVNQFENYQSKKNLKIAIIQPNIDPWNKWRVGIYDNISRHVRVQDSLIAQGQSFDLALWTETSITYSSPETNSKPYNLPMLQSWADEHKASIISGFSELVFFDKKESAPSTAKKFGDENRYYQLYNASILISPHLYSDTSQIYRKMILTPFSERVPYVELFSFAQSLLEWDVGISNWGLGWEQHNLTCHTEDRGDFSLPSIICIESIHPDFVRKFAKSGAELFTIITNDSWFTFSPGPSQHFAIAQMRAIENRRYIARCSNAGISGFISPTGAIIKQADKFCDTGIISSLPAINEITIYSSIGDMILIQAILLALATSYILSIRNKKKLNK